MSPADPPPHATPKAAPVPDAVPVPPPASHAAPIESVALAVHEPFDGAGLATWFAARAVPGVEAVIGGAWTRAVALRHGAAVLHADLTAPRRPGRLDVRLGLEDPRDREEAVALTRHLLDLDAEPQTVDAHLARTIPALAGSVADRPGVRVPGTPSLVEALLWAIVGQQITVAHTLDQMTRATDAVAAPLPPRLQRDGVTRLPADPVAAATAPEWYRGPEARRRALRALAQAAPEITEAAAATRRALAGPAPASGSDAVARLRTRLLALPGVGPWTADYALIRGLRCSDLVPAGDVALLAGARRLGLLGPEDPLTALLPALAPAAPWRTHAVMHLWHAAPVRPGRR
ncbi:DNA-3-methyladenine glycosylase family protein [Brachybacterium sillae]|uniref:DNA-3-methyladenine glycosylase family protein n=1 Tax=Brachybacterium sillae TaxID=2810536 RepID=UPI00217D603B|nr:AlkA N-terminal domain-containing protein [Brachybacterium sillae]